MIEPYVIVGPGGIVHVGLYTDEKGCWRVYLGWPTVAEVNWYKEHGYYCSKANLTWTKPEV